MPPRGTTFVVEQAVMEGDEAVRLVWKNGYLTLPFFSSEEGDRAPIEGDSVSFKLLSGAQDSRDEEKTRRRENHPSSVLTLHGVAIPFPSSSRLLLSFGGLVSDVPLPKEKGGWEEGVRLEARVSGEKGCTKRTREGSQKK